MFLHQFLQLLQAAQVEPAVSDIFEIGYSVATPEVVSDAVQQRPASRLSDQIERLNTAEAVRKTDAQQLHARGFRIEDGADPPQQLNVGSRLLRFFEVILIAELPVSRTIRLDFRNVFANPFLLLFRGFSCPLLRSVGAVITGVHTVCAQLIAVFTAQMADTDTTQ